jgi:hypothetical protein
MTKKVFQFNLDSSSLKIKEVLTTKDFIMIELWGISNEYPTNNNSHFPLHTMEQNVKNNTFFGKPILGKFNNVTNNYEVHNSKEKYDPEFDVSYYDYEDGERPLGYVREGVNTVRIEKDENGLSWIVFTAVLWVKYNYQGIKKLLKAKRSKISVEVTINESHEDENGVEIFDDWVFDGATILGYRPHSRVEAKEGINNAHMTIVEKMKKETFSQRMKKITFAYDNIDETDIKEIDSRLYIEETLQKEAKPLTEDVKKNEEFIQEEQVESKEEFVEDSEKIENTENSEQIKEEESCKEKETETVEETKEEETCKEKEIEACGDEEKCSENETKDANCGNFENPEEEKVEESKEDNCCNFEEDDANDGKDDIDHPDDQDGDSDDSKEENSEDSEETCGKFEEEKSEEDKAVNTDDENQEDVKMSVEMFTIDGVEYTGQQLFEKYQNDLTELQSRFDAMKVDFDIANEKIAKYEEAEKKAFVDKLCEDVKAFVSEKNLVIASMGSILDKCKEGAIATFEEAKKEVIYEAYKESETIPAKKEFSTKADDMRKSQSSENVVKTPLQGLKEFINK